MILDLLHKSEKGKHLRIKTLISLISSGANASPIQLKIDFCNRSIDVSLENCGLVNAFYSRSDQKITICKELIEDFVTTFSPDNKSTQQLAKDVLNATVFVFYHGMGHAQISGCIRFANYWSRRRCSGQFCHINSHGQQHYGGDAVLTAAQWFSAGLKGIPFWDEHSLKPQRFFSIPCTVYGSNPEKSARLVSDSTLPEPRAVRCPREYEQKEKSWSRLLALYVKKN